MTDVRVDCARKGGFRFRRGRAVPTIPNHPVRDVRVDNARKEGFIFRAAPMMVYHPVTDVRVNLHGNDFLLPLWTRCQLHNCSAQGWYQAVRACFLKC